MAMLNAQLECVMPAHSHSEAYSAVTQQPCSIQSIQKALTTGYTSKQKREQAPDTLIEHPSHPKIDLAFPEFYDIRSPTSIAHLPFLELT
jgi:hypothetical protein